MSDRARSRFHINPARLPADMKAAAELFGEYAQALAIDLSYQSFGEELASLPGKYAPPAGELLVARDAGGEPLGCVALRPLEEPGCCEMKRLYVRPAARGLGVGRALVDAIIREARGIGYGEVRLDTLPDMSEAISLYVRSGFGPIAPYYETPIRSTVFLGKRLRQMQDHVDAACPPQKPTALT